MNKDSFLEILQEITKLLESKPVKGFFVSLGIRDNENDLLYHNIYKNMNYLDISDILIDTKNKIDNEFGVSTMPLALTQTKAKA